MQLGLNWNDTKNMMSKMTGRRMSNSLRVLSSYYHSRSRSLVRHRGMPISISFEPTTSCNLRCPECPSGLRSFTRPTGMLEKALYDKVLDELAPTLLYLTLYFQGEPYLHPDFFDLILTGTKHNIYTATSTNAHYLDSDNARNTVESGLDRIIISIDGLDQETYEQYRVGGRLEQVIEGTKNLIHWKKALGSLTPHIIFQFVVFRQNEDQIGKLKKLGEEIGVNEVAIKTAQIYDYEKGSDLIPVNNRYSRYELNGDGSWKIKNKLLDHCWKMWHSSVVTWDGKVVPCCFDKDAKHIMGDTKKQRFGEIWNSPKYDEFRKSLLRSRSDIDICTNCTEGTKVWA